MPGLALPASTATSTARKTTSAPRKSRRMPSHLAERGHIYGRGDRFRSSKEEEVDKEEGGRGGRQGGGGKGGGAEEGGRGGGGGGGGVGGGGVRRLRDTSSRWLFYVRLFLCVLWGYFLGLRYLLAGSQRLFVRGGRDHRRECQERWMKERCIEFWLS